METKSLLLGESATPEDQRQIVAALEAGGAGVSVIHLRTLHLGPEELLVAAKIAVAHDDTAASVARAIDDAEVRDPRGRADRPGDLPGAGPAAARPGPPPPSPAPCAAVRPLRKRARDRGARVVPPAAGHSRGMSSTELSPERRRADRARLADEVVDVLVIGGGVTGAGAALDAASRGLTVGLLEARDWAAGTSSRSSKLIHGGLRYLEQLAFPLVHEALQERARLATTIAPHLVRPLPFLLPLTAPVWQRAYFGAGVALYDVMGAAMTVSRTATAADPAAPAPVPRGHARGVPGAARRRRPGRDPVLGRPGRRRAAHAGRRPDGGRLRGAGAQQCPGGRAAARRRRVRTHPVVGVRVADLTDGSSFTVRARSVVAATGVWSDDIGAMLGASAPSLRVRASKGVHLVVPRSAIDGADVRRAAVRRPG